MKTLILLPLASLAIACQPVARTVTYRVTGDPDWPKTDGMGPTAHIVIRNSDGGTEMHDIQTPFSEQLAVGAGSFVYLSAQAREGSEITCEIDMDGKVVRRSESDGEFSIATCSGTA